MTDSLYYLRGEKEILDYKRRKKKTEKKVRHIRDKRDLIL